MPIEQIVVTRGPRGEVPGFAGGITTSSRLRKDLALALQGTS